MHPMRKMSSSSADGPFYLYNFSLFNVFEHFVSKLSKIIHGVERINGRQIYKIPMLCVNLIRSEHKLFLTKHSKAPCPTTIPKRLLGSEDQERVREDAHSHLSHSPLLLLRPAP
jgi:hypothetical protein